MQEPTARVYFGGLFGDGATSLPYSEREVVRVGCVAPELRCFRLNNKQKFSRGMESR